jgi:hypothetical protein
MKKTNASVRCYCTALGSLYVSLSVYYPVSIRCIVLFSYYSFNQHGCSARDQRQILLFLKERSIYYAEILNVREQL